MNIFHKRPLGLILCITLSGFSLFAVLPSVLRMPLMAVCLISIALSFLLKGLNNKILLKVTLCSLLLSFILSFLYFEVVFYPTKYYDKEAEITGKVIISETVSEYHQIIDLKVSSIDENNCSYKIKVNLYGDNDDIVSGTVIKFNTKLQEFEGDESFDFKTYYTSDGFSATADIIEFDIVDLKNESLVFHFKQIRQQICERAEKFSNESAAALLGAGLLGERDMLSGQVSLDFQRIGISHILALSGMHLAIIFGLLDKIFISFKFGRKTRTLIECVFCFAFMALTGFPLSVCRAGIMLILSSILYLLSGSKDGITSLFVSLALIILAMPYAAVDIGLWLSVTATAGILLASEFINDKYNEERGLKRVLREITTSILFSLFAVSATSAITSLNFSTASVLSILSTLIFSVLIEFYVYLGILVLLIGGILPIGNLLIEFEIVIVKMAAIFSDLPMICASTSFLTVKIIYIAISVLFMGLAIFKIKQKKILIAVITSTFILSSLVSVMITEIQKGNDLIISVNDASDKLIIRTDGKVMLFDASLHKKSDGYHNANILYKEGITELDCYFVANYTEYLPESVPIMLSKISVGSIKLPMPTNSEEEDIAIEIFNVLADFRTEISFYEDNMTTKIGKCEILIRCRSSIMDSLGVTFKVEDNIYSYLSSGTLEYLPNSSELLYISDVIIFGTWGKSYSSAIIVDEYNERLKKIIICDEKVYFGTTDETENLPDAYFYNKKTIIYN